MDRWDVIAVTCTQADHANAFSQGLVSLLRRFEGRVVCMQIVESSSISSAVAHILIPP